MREGGPIEPLERYRDRLKEIFKAHGVVLAYLFGSQAQGKAGPLSDVDVAVLFGDDVPQEERFDRVLELIGELMGVFHRNDIYVVDLGKAPPLLRNEVRRSGQLLYCPDDRVRVQFEVAALREYLDTKPIREVQWHYLRRRIKQGIFGIPPERQRLEAKGGRS